MAWISYFAYGSNMLTERLQARCRSARLRGPAQADGFTLSFSKRSDDGSGKATVVASDASACVYGVVFDIDEGDVYNLDRSEGPGYNRENAFEVVMEPDRLPLSVTTYMANCQYVNHALKPYNWYVDLIVAGARQHHLPLLYIKALAETCTVDDPNPNRKSRVEALTLLAQTGIA